MELVRIIEKDDKTARDKIKKIYGNDETLITDDENNKYILKENFHFLKLKMIQEYLKAVIF